MIKKYNQFIKEDLNKDNQEDNFDSNINEFDDIDNTDDLEDDELVEDEDEDIYSKNLNELAQELGTTVSDGKIIYKGKKILFPSETEMFHVDSKKFKTIEEVLNYLNVKDEKNIELEDSNEFSIDREDDSTMDEEELESVRHELKYRSMNR